MKKKMVEEWVDLITCSNTFYSDKYDYCSNEEWIDERNDHFYWELVKTLQEDDIANDFYHSILYAVDLLTLSIVLHPFVHSIVEGYK